MHKINSCKDISRVTSIAVTYYTTNMKLGQKTKQNHTFGVEHVLVVVHQDGAVVD